MLYSAFVFTPWNFHKQMTKFKVEYRLRIEKRLAKHFEGSTLNAILEVIRTVDV